MTNIPNTTRSTTGDHIAPGQISNAPGAIRLATLSVTECIKSGQVNIAPPPGSISAADYETSPVSPALEFIRYISAQFLAASRQTKATTCLAAPASMEDAIAVRADMFRDVIRSLSADTRTENDAPRMHNQPAIPSTTAQLWARLDADDFRVLNNLNRDMYAPVAQRLNENACQSYQDALRQYAPDLYNIIGAARRDGESSNSPVRQLPSKTRCRGQYALAFDGSDGMRPIRKNSLRCGG